MTSNTKEWIQYSTATGMVLSGAALAFASFFMQGEVTDGVLMYVGEALTYAGGIFGVSIYFRTKLGESRDELMQWLKSTTGKQTEEQPPP